MTQPTSTNLPTSPKRSHSDTFTVLDAEELGRPRKARASLADHPSQEHGKRCCEKSHSPIAATHAQNSPQAQDAAPPTDLPAVPASPTPSRHCKRRQEEAIGHDDSVEGDEGHRSKRHAPSPSASSSSAVVPTPSPTKLRRRQRRSRKRHAAPAPEEKHQPDAKERELEAREQVLLAKEQELEAKGQELAHKRSALEADKAGYMRLTTGIRDSMVGALQLQSCHAELKRKHEEVLVRMEVQSERFRRSQTSLLEKNAFLRRSLESARRGVDSLQDELRSLRGGHVLRQHYPHACTSDCPACQALV